MKSLCLAYLFWAIGGFFGLHHFYLKRYKHAFVWFCLPGGFFGLGWLRDLWRIPEYVKDANNDQEYLEILSSKIRTYNKPPWKFARVIGQILLGNIFGCLSVIAWPEPEELGIDFKICQIFTQPLFCAIGIWIVGNIGREKGSLIYPLLGCFIVAPLYHFYYINQVGMSIISTIVFHIFSKQWQRKVQQSPSRLKSTIYFLFFCSLYASIWSSYIYFNMTVLTSQGEEIKFRDSAKNFIKSPAFQEFSKNIQKLYTHLKEHGFQSMYEEFIDSLDPLGEKHSLKVLNLKKGCSLAEIKSKFRELSKSAHPDKFQGEAEKAIAHARFMEITEAYEKLTKIIKSRNKNADLKSQK